MVSGTWGEDTSGSGTWELNESTGVLTISGSGDIPSDSTYEYFPWADYASSIKSIIINSGITSIGYYAFSRTAVISVTIADTVTTIGENSFANCTSLTTVNLPESMTSILRYAFYKCSALTSINIPKSVTTITQSSFSYCSALSSIDIPEGVTTIGTNAFANCTNLRSIVLPKSLTTVEHWAFSSCYNISEVTFKGAQATVGNGSFSLGTSSNKVTATIYSTGWANSTIFTSGSYTDVGSYYTTFNFVTVKFNPEISVNVSGTWKKSVPYVNVNGTWKEVTAVYVNVDGTWKEAV